MSSFSVRLPIGVTPSEYFREIPKSAKVFLRQGFKTLGLVHAKYSAAITSLIVESISSGGEPEITTLKDKFGVDDAATPSLAGAISFLMLILSAPNEPEPAAQIVERLVAADMLDPEAQQAVISLLGDLDKEKAKVRSGFKRSALASAILPALSDIELQVDLRVEFDKEQVILSVPVLLVHIDTDAAHEELWLQMSMGQLRKLIEEMKKALSQMEAAESWARREKAQ